MITKINDKFECIDPSVLSPYYDSKFNGQILTVTSDKVPKVRNIDGGSVYFIIMTTGEKTKRGNENRFSVSLDKINKKHFKRIK